MSRSRRSGRRLDGDAGAATSMTVALLTPVVLVLALAAVQAALWSHARTEARVVARDAAALVARSGAAPDDARAAAEVALDTVEALSDVRVTVERSTGVVTVTVAAAAPGIIRGTSASVTVTEAVPIEEVTPR